MSIEYFVRNIGKNATQVVKKKCFAIADTHGNHEALKTLKTGGGDWLFVAGDFTVLGHADEVSEFNRWLGTLDFEEKFVIAGKLDLSFDPHKVRHSLLALLFLTPKDAVEGWR